MKENRSISGAEYEIMEVLWKADKPLSIQSVCEGIADEKWKYNTVGTMLLRLLEKGAVKSQKENRVIYYSAVLKREEYKKEQTRQLVSRLYGGSVRNLAVSLLGSDEMTADDLAEIRKMFNI
jgi:predicted transcriptional regulator